MFTDWLRKVTKWLLVPIARVLGRLGISANALTLIGCALTIGVAIVIATGRFQLGGLLLIAAAGLDGVDGMVARQMGKATKFGSFLDSVIDRVSESVLFLGIAWWYMGQPGQIEELLAYVAIVGAMLVSYTRARAEGIGVDCKVGLFTRVERAIVLVLALLFNLMTPALWLLAVGTMATSIHRMVHVYLQVREQPLKANLPGE
ncbi:MAG: CDP-alcohol phosphatidyltransferase family protein [Anaerolineae bacterium]